MAVAFPTGHNLERSTTFTRDSNIQADILADGETRLRDLGPDTFVTIACKFLYLSLADKNTLKNFLITNRTETITWTIDGIDYSGVFVGDHTETMKGPRYSLSFQYRAKEV